MGGGRASPQPTDPTIPPAGVGPCDRQALRHRNSRVRHCQPPPTPSPGVPGSLASASRSLPACCSLTPKERENPIIQAPGAGPGLSPAPLPGGRGGSPLSRLRPGVWTREVFPQPPPPAPARMKDNRPRTPASSSGIQLPGPPLHIIYEGPRNAEPPSVVLPQRSGATPVLWIPLGPKSPGTSSLLSPLGPTSSEQIMKTGALLLQGFIQDRAGRMGGETPELGLEQAPQDASTKKLSECLKRIGDELDSNMELQRMIAAVDTDSPREVFFRVAAEMFSDGNFNWGRVVALFYFASKLVLKALCTKVPELIRTIMGWTLDFLRERLLGWIQDQGGWDGLLSYFGTPTWQTVTIFVAGVLTASLTIWKKMG